MVEIELQGLNARQKVLADIMWDLAEWDQVEAFMASLPKRDRIGCEGIIAMMKMELVEQYAEGMKEDSAGSGYTEADQLINKIKRTK
jgi:hypothetical protein